MSEELKKEWVENFEQYFEMKNFALYSKKHDIPATTNEIKELINLLLAKQQEEFVKCIPEIKMIEGNGFSDGFSSYKMGYNQCLADIKSKLNK